MVDVASQLSGGPAAELISPQISINVLPKHKSTRLALQNEEN